MRIAALLGNQPRHLALQAALQDADLLAGTIIQEKVKHKLDFMAFEKPLRSTVRKHFRLRDEAEALFFGNSEAGATPSLEIKGDDLNSRDVELFLRGLDADLVVIWGTALVSDSLMESVGLPFWNIHGGLSPDYKGAATMFWPSYFLEPQMTGMTLHVPISRIDAGPIIHQVAATLTPGDGLQMHSARTVRNSIDEIVSLLKTVGSKELPRGISQRRAGKLFLESDWRPEHLTLVYETFEDKIIDLAIKGDIAGKTPRLVSALVAGV